MWCGQQKVHCYLDQAAAVVFMPPLAQPHADDLFALLKKRGATLDAELCSQMAARRTRNWGCGFRGMPNGRDFEEELPDVDVAPAPGAERRVKEAFPSEKVEIAQAMFEQYMSARGHGAAEGATYRNEYQAAAAETGGDSAAARARAAAAVERARAEAAAKQDTSDESEVSQAVRDMYGETLSEATSASHKQAKKLAKELQKSNVSIPRVQAAQERRRADKQKQHRQGGSHSGYATGAGAAGATAQHGAAAHDGSDPTNAAAEAATGTEQPAADTQPAPGSWVNWEI